MRSIKSIIIFAIAVFMMIAFKSVSGKPQKLKADVGFDYTSIKFGKPDRKIAPKIKADASLDYTNIRFGKQPVKKVLPKPSADVSLDYTNIRFGNKPVRSGIKANLKV